MTTAIAQTIMPVLTMQSAAFVKEHSPGDFFQIVVIVANFAAAHIFAHSPEVDVVQAFIGRPNRATRRDQRDKNRLFPFVSGHSLLVKVYADPVIRIYFGRPFNGGNPSDM